MFVREWLRNCAPVPQSPPPAAAQTCYWGAQRQQSTHTAPTPPPAFWGGQHKVIPGWCKCAFQNPTQTATAISFPSKIPPKETWPSILHSKYLPKSHGHHFPMQQCKAKPIPFNKQAVATFIGLLGNVCWIFSFWQFSYCSGSQGWQQTLLSIFWGGIVLLKPETPQLAFKRNETFHLPLIKLLSCDFSLF